MANATTDARTVRTRRVVVAAVAGLLEEEGVTAITHQRVAERAEVGRATLYRHWPRPVDLLFDALGEVEEPLLHHGTGTLRTWLIHELHRAAVELTQPISVQFMAVLLGASTTSEPAAALRDRLITRSVAPLAAALDRARSDGMLRGTPEPTELLAQLMGPVIFRVVLHGVPVDDAFIERTIDAALEPWVEGSGQTAVGSDRGT